MTDMTAPDGFTVRLDDDCVMWLSGELDMATAERFPQMVGANLDGQQPVLDLSEVTFIDSSGIRAILLLARRSAQTVVLRSVRPNVFKVFEVAGVDERAGVRIEPPDPGLRIVPPTG